LDPAEPDCSLLNLFSETRQKLIDKTHTLQRRSHPAKTTLDLA